MAQYIEHSVICQRYYDKRKKPCTSVRCKTYQTVETTSTVVGGLVRGFEHDIQTAGMMLESARVATTDDARQFYLSMYDSAIESALDYRRGILEVLGVVTVPTNLCACEGLCSCVAPF